MTKKNPDDSVREEQFGAVDNAAGTEDAIKAENAEEIKAEIEEPTPEQSHENEDIELPPVDYSGYSKHELVETLALIVENRAPAEIRNDVDLSLIHISEPTRL